MRSARGPAVGLSCCLLLLLLLLLELRTADAAEEEPLREAEERLGTPAERDRAAEATQLALQVRECSGECPWDMARFAGRVHGIAEFELAAKLYERTLHWARDRSDLWSLRLALSNNLGRVKYDVGLHKEAQQLLEPLLEPLASAPGDAWHRELNANVLNNLGLAYQRQGLRHEALGAFDAALALDWTLNGGEVHFNRGTVLDKLGRHHEALDEYDRSLALNPEFVAPLINAAALFHKHQMLPEAVARYKQVLTHPKATAELCTMARANLGVAYTQMGDAAAALESFQAVLEYQRGSGSEIQTRAQIATARRTVCDWQDFERDAVWLMDNVRDQELALGKPPSLLPFDSLLMPLPPAFRYDLAVAYGTGFATQAARPRPRPRIGQRLRVGYMSYDFNDHPTGHLVEELFGLHEARGRVESHTLSYGKDDGSVVRKRIERAGNVFHDLSEASHDESVRRIRDELQIDVLMDMQGFTLGGRPEVVAQRPAPVIVNYLVFAGTCGAPFVDYLIADKFVAPLEDADHFSEKLVLMPHTYQVNSYSHWGDTTTKSNKARAGARPPELGGASFVFANFNKCDKLEPLTFAAWMQVLQRVPGSVLWLLEPGRELSPAALRANLSAEARAHGVHPSRILFAKRVGKTEHIRRHAHADLFLDSLVYGAHSTATDAMRGGLPVLTVLGDAFASRVAASLLHAVGLPELVTVSVRDFVDTAVRIARSPGLARGLRRRLDDAHRRPLFDLPSHAQDLERALLAMADLNQPRHIIVKA